MLIGILFKRLKRFSQEQLHGLVDHIIVEAVWSLKAIKGETNVYKLQQIVSIGTLYY